MTKSKFEQGMKTRRQVLSNGYVDRAELNKTDFDADFQRFITEFAWGDAWQGEAISLQTRHMITIAILAAQGREHELALHLRATQNTGITAVELKEVFMHVAIYAGVPAANRAFAVAKQIFTE